MTQKLSEFSSARIFDTYQRIGLEISVHAQRETAHPPASPDAFPKIFRTPHRMIDEIINFKKRHSQASVDRLTAMPGIAVSDPWDRSAEDQLVVHMRAVVGRIRKLVVRNWFAAFPLINIVQERAEQELWQRISEEFEAGRITYWAAKNGRMPAATDYESQNASANASAQGRPRIKARMPRGKTTAELLQEWWSDADKRKELLSAGSAARIARLIGKSETAVKEAGPIWTSRIAPALKSCRIVAIVVRHEEERFNG